MPYSKIIGLLGTILLGSTHSVSADVILYGQINLALLSADNRQDTIATVVDNDASPTRAGVLATLDLSNTLRVGARVEYEVQYNPSNEVDLMGNDDIAPESARERHLNVFVRGTWGKLSLGRGDGAANGNLQRDLSGTSLISFSDPERIGGSIAFYDEVNNNTLALANTIRDQDFEHRYTRLRFDAPRFGSLATSLSAGRKGNNDVYELGIRIGSQYEIGKMEAAAGYSLEDFGNGGNAGAQAGNNITTGGSFSFLANSGINLTLAYSIETDENAANPDSKFGMAKLGYKRGKHAFSLSYMQSNDRDQLDDESSAFLIGYVLKQSDSVDFYAGYKVHSLDRPGAAFDDIGVGMIGARFKLQIKPFANR